MKRQSMSPLKPLIRSSSNEQLAAMKWIISVLSRCTQSSNTNFLSFVLCTRSDWSAVVHSLIVSVELMRIPVRSNALNDFNSFNMPKNIFHELPSIKSFPTNSVSCVQCFNAPIASVWIKWRNFNEFSCAIDIRTNTQVIVVTLVQDSKTDVISAAGDSVRYPSTCQEGAYVQSLCGGVGAWCSVWDVSMLNKECSCHSHPVISGRWNSLKILDPAPCYRNEAIGTPMQCSLQLFYR